jgi:hypothetical protein
MEIGPVSNRPAGHKLEGAGSQRQEKQAATEARPPVQDQADISNEARARLAELADRERVKEQAGPEPVTAGDLSNEERLEIIKKRVAAGYYDEPGVRARIVDKLIDDLDQ